jgi:predicted small lipoprotein YifL
MKKILFKSGIALLLLAALTGCKKKFQEEEQAESGPQITVNSYSQTAIMGGKVNFSVAISDSKFALSTLKAALLFDETPVDNITIRTKEAGTYTGTLQVPFLANVPDGTATLLLVAENVGRGKTTINKNVAVSRPVFEYLTLTDDSGHDYRMDHGEGFNYAVTGDFPSEVKATITTAPVGDNDTTFTFGFKSGAIVLGGADPIPFSNGIAGNYTISFNTFTFEGAPFTRLAVNGADAVMIDGDNYAAVVSLTQNGEVKIEGYAPGFKDWIIDPDFLEATAVDGTYKFLAMDGLYRFNIGIADKFFKVEAMSSATEYGKLSADCSGTLWLIGGDCYGKPVIWSYSWNPERGGLCFAQISPKVHQLTFVAGVQLKTNAIDIKVFGQKSWGIEFGGANTTDSKLITIGASDGNIRLAEDVKLDMGGIYRLTVDLNGAVVSDNKITGAVVHFEKVGQQEVEAPKVIVNGVELTQLSLTDYSGVVNFEKDGAITVSGIDDIASYYFDPDYLYFEGGSAKFAPASGLYTVNILGGIKDIRFKRMKDADNEATIAEHGLWLMGWGVASPSMEHAQFGFTPGAAYCMAEIADHVYKFSGQASNGEHDTTPGTRFRNDYLSFKYFGQDGWGAEKGKMFGTDATVKLSDRAAALLKDAGNIELADGIQLETGATYILTIDLSVSGVETIDFYKQ